MERLNSCCFIIKGGLGAGKTTFLKHALSAHKHVFHDENFSDASILIAAKEGKYTAICIDENLSLEDAYKRIERIWSLWRGVYIFVTVLDSKVEGVCIEAFLPPTDDSNTTAVIHNSEADLLISAYNKGCFRLAIILLATVILGAIQLFI